jgi:magnesium chelatase accessory protein
MPEKPDWLRDGRDWPNRDASRFVDAGGLRWHVQQMGQGPDILLVHGTGASTHSWRDLLPLLATTHRVTAMDLPGHGFTSTPNAAGLSLPGMANGLAALLRTLGMTPDIVIGHSAGAPILARLCLDGTIAPRVLIALNGAFLPLGGAPAQFFSPVAKLFARIPLIPQAFSWHVADRRVVERLLRGTGSTIDARGIDLYGRLMRRPGHAAAALGMMANWDLVPIERDLPLLKTRLLMIVGANDKTIPPADAVRVQALLPASELIRVPELGHLLHEEKPKEVEEIVRKNVLF